VSPARDSLDRIVAMLGKHVPLGEPYPYAEIEVVRNAVEGFGSPEEATFEFTGYASDPDRHAAMDAALKLALVNGGDSAEIVANAKALLGFLEKGAEA
jgi:hypothetical protein